jgi:outer membrane receptor protein involved in Fe transport
MYISASKGFMPPTIDDMTRSGKIRKGIKIANPFLEPELLYNIETGFQLKIGKKLVLEPSLYYSIAKNMIYQVWTGDSVEILSDGPKPMIQKRNVSEGTVAGAEIAIHYSPKNWLDIQAGYSFNNSVITKYKALEGDADITGLYMAEVPKNLISTDLHLKYNVFTFTIEYRYTDLIFADDENLTTVAAFHLVNLNLGARIKNYNIGISVNDLFDVQYIDRKGLLSPGRFFSGRISVKL